jgi:hypothetical protein
LLVELGLGIHRRLNDKRVKKDLPPLGTSKMSFWYLANKLGKSFLAKASQRLPGLEQWKHGVWAATNLERKIFLVSGSDLAVEEDSLPLHVLGKESAEKEVETAKLIYSDAKLRQLFGDLYNFLHRDTVEELEAMNKIKSAKDVMTFRPEMLLEFYGKKKFSRGLRQLFSDMESDEKQEMLRDLIGSLTPHEWEEVKRRLK